MDQEPPIEHPPTQTYSAEHLREFAAQVFQQLEIPSEDARLAADVLLTSDLRGIESHGVARLPSYVKL